MFFNVEFNITSFCQARCISCVRTDEVSGGLARGLIPKHISITDFKKMLDNLGERQISEIRLQGETGDPMMHPQIEKIIKLAFAKTDRIIIITNGGLRKPEWYTELGKKFTGDKKIAIMFCIDGLDHKTSWKYREGVDWGRAMSNMRAWAATGHEVHWKFILFTWNQNQYKDAYRLSQKLGITFTCIVNQRPYGYITDAEVLKNFYTWKQDNKGDNLH